MAFGSSYRKVRKTERNWDSTEFLGCHTTLNSLFRYAYRVASPFSTEALDVAFCGYSKAFYWRKSLVHIVYVIESAAYGVLCTSCLCQKPERARYERVRAFDTNNEWIKPRTKCFLFRKLFITHNTRIFIVIVFWTQITNKNPLTM